QYIYEQLTALRQKQKEQYAQQMQMNDRLVAKLADQGKHQQVQVEQLMAQKKVTKAREQGLRMAAEFSVKHKQQLGKRTGAPSFQVVYGFEEVTKAPTFDGRMKVQMRRFMDQYEAYTVV
ncbi:unnamed protein product, partial [Aphanomyces euteiches]